MKKINLILAVLFAAFSFALTSCGGSDDTTPPSITLDKTTATAKVGDKVNVVITLSSTVDLKSIAVSPSTVGGATTGFQADATLFDGSTQNFKSGKSGASVKYDYVVPTGVTEVTLTFTVTDKNTTNTATCKITVGAVIVAGQINTWTSTLGGGNSSTGSYYASLTGTVYLEAAAKTNSASIDAVYYYSSSAGIYAPNSSTITSTYAGWVAATTKNATKFATTTITAAAFDAMTDDSGITTVAGAASADNVTGLSVGQVIAFKTAGGKLGLIKITSITGNNTGTIGIACKIQKPAI